MANYTVKGTYKERKKQGRTLKTKKKDKMAQTPGDAMRALRGARRRQRKAIEAMTN